MKILLTFIPIFMTVSFSKNKSFYFLLAFFSLFLTSCNDDTSLIGLELHPKGQSLNIFLDTLTNGQAKTMREDSSFVTASDIALFGLLNDPVFGQTEASFMARVYANSWVIQDSNLVNLDSANLFLNIAGYYGDKSRPQSIQVMEMNSPVLHLDTTYLNQISIFDLVKPVVLAEKTFLPKAQVLKIKLPAHFNTRFISNFKQIKANTALVGNQKDSALAEVLKGFYFKKGNVGLGEALSSVNFGTNSKLVFYFDPKNQDDSSSVESIDFNFSTRFFNFYQHRHTDKINSYLRDTSYTDSVFYIQSTSGLKARLDFEDITQWTLQEKVAVNRAQIIIPVDTTDVDFSIYPVPEQLLLKKIDENGLEEYVEDFFSSSQTEGITYKGAVYNSTYKQYSFDITRHFQKLVSDKTRSVSYYLHAYKTSSRAQRAVLCNKTHSRPVKLIVTYTKLY